MFTLFFLQLACTTDNTLGTAQDLYADVPRMVVEPSALEFGGLAAGERALDQFEIRNEGGAPLTIADVWVEGAVGFTLLGNPVGVLPPYGAVSVDVQYAATDVDDAAVVHIEGDDPAAPDATVTLGGRLLLPELEIDPDAIDLGGVPWDCVAVTTLTLRNVGETTLAVDRAVVVGDGWSVREPSGLPIDLEPGEDATLDVSFTPPGDGDAPAEAWVGSNDPAGDRRAALTAHQTPGACVEASADEDGGAMLTLEYTVEEPRLDLTFVVDTSSSMTSVIPSLAADLSSLVDLAASTFDEATFGVATFEDYSDNPYCNGWASCHPFVLRQQQTDDLALAHGALASELEIHNGWDNPESSLEALYQALTGVGYDMDCDGAYDFGDVLPFVASPDDPFGGTAGEARDTMTPGTGESGGMGYREGAMPILVLVTDNMMRDADDATFQVPGGCPADAGLAAVLSAADALDARVFGAAVNGYEWWSFYEQMEDMVEANGAYADLDGDGETEAAMVRWSVESESFPTEVVIGISGLLAGYGFDNLEIVVAEDPTGLVVSVDPVAHADVRTGETATFLVTLAGVTAGATLVFELYGDGELLYTWRVAVQPA